MRRDASSRPLPTTSTVVVPDRTASEPDRSGNIPATTSNATVPVVANPANQSSETQCGSIASMAVCPWLDLFGRRRIAGRMPGYAWLRRPRGLAHVGLDEAGV